MLTNLLRKFVSRNSKLGLELEADQWVKEAKKSAKIWRNYFKSRN